MLTASPKSIIAFAAIGMAAWALGLGLADWQARAAEANGASTIVMDRAQGPYRMVVGIIPARPVIPQTHLAIQVFDVSDPRPLRDTEVRMTVVTSGPPGSTGFGPHQVLNEQTLRYFEVDVPFAITGPVGRVGDGSIGTGRGDLRAALKRGRTGRQHPVDLDHRGAGHDHRRWSVDLAHSAAACSPLPDEPPPRSYPAAS